MYSTRQIIEEEAEQVHKIFRNRPVDWVLLYSEVEYFQDGDIDLMELLPLLIGKLYNQMVKKDKGETTSNFDWVPLMANASKFQIVCLNAEIRNERIISIRNNVVTEGKILLSDDKIDMIVVLSINSEFIEFMLSKNVNFSSNNFNVTIVGSDGEE